MFMNIHIKYKTEEKKCILGRIQSFIYHHSFFDIIYTWIQFILVSFPNEFYINMRHCTQYIHLNYFHIIIENVLSTFIVLYFLYSCMSNIVLKCHTREKALASHPQFYIIHYMTKKKGKL